jgi:hypothetical protein
MVLTGTILATLSFGDLLRAADRADIFYYVLPFLLVFALIYGILTKSTLLGNNKGVNIIISLALGLLSLVGNYFPNFIQQMSPKLAIGLSLILALIILLGLFAQGATWLNNLFVWVGIIIFIIIVYSSLAHYSFIGNNAWNTYAPAIITIAIIGAVIYYATK